MGMRLGVYHFGLWACSTHNQAFPSTHQNTYTAATATCTYRVYSAATSAGAFIAFPIPFPNQTLSPKARHLIPAIYTVWQSRLENEHYSIAYFNCVTAFEVQNLQTSVKSSAETCCVNAATIDATTMCYFC